MGKDGRLLKLTRDGGFYLECKSILAFTLVGAWYVVGHLDQREYGYWMPSKHNSFLKPFVSGNPMQVWAIRYKEVLAIGFGRDYGIIKYGKWYIQ